MGFLKKAFKGIKKVAKVGLAVGGAYAGYKGLQSMGLRLPGGTSATSYPVSSGSAQTRDLSDPIPPPPSSGFDYSSLIAPGAALGAAGLSYLGGRSQNIANARQASSQMDFQSQSQDKQMAFQDEQSRTQWQRATADMQAAGLNPMLAYSQGGNATMGGSTQSGAQAHMENTISPAIASARDTATFQAQLQNIKAQNANIMADTDLKRAQAPAATAGAYLSSASAADASARAGSGQYRAQAGAHNASALYTGTLEEGQRSKNVSYQAETVRDTELAKMWKENPELMAYITQGGSGALSSAAGAAASIRNMFRGARFGRR